MKAKTMISLLCTLGILFGQVPCASANEQGEPLAVIADIVVVRPACLVATAVGAGFFLVSLPFAAMSKSVKRTADTLVGKPARATFTRPIGEMDTLGD